MLAARPLTGAHLVGYLLDVGVLTAEDVVRRGVRVEDRSRRNLAHLVLIGEPGGRSLFVKQGLGQDRQSCLAAEVAAYHVTADIPALDPFLVPVRHVDTDRSVLVLDAVPASRTVREHHLVTRRLPIFAARQLGAALRHLHVGYPAKVPAALRAGPADVLRLHRPTQAAVGSTSPGGQAVLEMLQGRAARALLDSAAADWRDEALVHGDVRWDNVLLSAPGHRRVSRLILVDWELARVGDPAWDLGAALGEYLVFWVLSLPVAADVSPARALAAARFPLSRVQTPLRSLWHGYLGVRPVPADLRLRAARYAGCRLVQAGFEHADRSMRLPAHSVVCVQLGLNLLARPLDGAAHVLGLDLGPTA